MCSTCQCLPGYIGHRLVGHLATARKSFRRFLGFSFNWMVRTQQFLDVESVTSIYECSAWSYKLTVTDRLEPEQAKATTTTTTTTTTTKQSDFAGFVFACRD